MTAIIYILPLLWLFMTPPDPPPPIGPVGGYEEPRVIRCKDCNADTIHGVESSVKRCTVCGKVSSL